MSTRKLDEHIFVAGHRGMVGSAIVRRLQSLGYGNVVTATHAELDLTSQNAVNAFFAGQQIDRVVLAAAKVGGIHANDTYPAEFISENLQIQSVRDYIQELPDRLNDGVALGIPP